MKYKIFFFAIYLLATLQTFAQSDAELTKSMLLQADDMGKKFIAKDYKAFLAYSHPATVKIMGGKEKMISETTKEFTQLESEGIKFLDVKFGVPSKIVRTGKELQSIIPEIIEMKVKGGKLTTTTSLIAISQDNGKNWFFVDSAGNNLQNMKGLLPTLSDELEIPMPQDPSFEEDPKTE